jgi:hypothetical protein
MKKLSTAHHYAPIYTLGKHLAKKYNLDPASVPEYVPQVVSTAEALAHERKRLEAAGASPEELSEIDRLMSDPSQPKYIPNVINIQSLPQQQDFRRQFMGSMAGSLGGAGIGYALGKLLASQGLVDEDLAPLIGAGIGGVGGSLLGGQLAKR